MLPLDDVHDTDLIIELGPYQPVLRHVSSGRREGGRPFQQWEDAVAHKGSRWRRCWGHATSQRSGQVVQQHGLVAATAQVIDIRGQQVDVQNVAQDSTDRARGRVTAPLDITRVFQMGPDALAEADEPTACGHPGYDHGGNHSEDREGHWSYRLLRRCGAARRGVNPTM